MEYLQTGVDVVQRFYPVQLAMKQREEGSEAKDAKEGEKKEPPVEQIWIIKCDRTEKNSKIMKILQELHTEGRLDDFMDAELREDRAPKGSMRRALEAIM